MRRKPKHLFALAYARSKSATVALNALRFVVEYGRMCDGVEDVSAVRIEDFAAYTGLSRAQAFRRQASYRTCFPNQDVLHLWEHVIRPNLDASSFKDEPVTMQAVFAGTLTIGLS